jgi:hypothetical protein
MCQPHGPLLRELIRERGYSVAGFARFMRRTKSVHLDGPVPGPRTLWRAIDGNRITVEFIRPVARGLRVKPSVISDWTGDDDLYESEPEPKASA